MLAKESVKNYAEQLEKYADYVATQIGKTIEVAGGGRPSGYEQEHKAQDYVIEHMTGTADEVRTEGFTLHPKAFMGWVLIDGICMLIAAILLIINFFVAPSKALIIVALILTVISVACILGEFLFYKQFLDPLFPAKNAKNVICTRKAAGETKRRIIFSGHVDSAWEWRYTYLGGGRCLTAVIATAIVCLIADFVIILLATFGVTAAWFVVVAKIFAI
ncbi:MAG: hypothetical protein Q4F70_02980, partial [Clostridia bacterium]|nr:hypothetical protein [Clostridia bacterium]